MMKWSYKVVFSIIVCFILIYMYVFVFLVKNFKLFFNIIFGDENVLRSKLVMDFIRVNNVRRVILEIW